MRKRWLILIVVVGPLLALGAATCAAESTILYVTPDGGGSCTDSWANACTLQTALSTATYGDEIWVATGLYTPTTEAFYTATFQLKSGVALYGGFAGDEGSRDGRDWKTNVTVLSGDIDNNDVTGPHGVLSTTAGISGTNSYHVVTSSGVTQTAILDGFTITGGSADGSYPHDSGGGMYNSSDGSPLLANVTFSGNSAGGGTYPAGGGMYNYESSPTLVNVIFSGNSAAFTPGISGVGGAMSNSFHSSPTLVNVVFSGNSALSGGAMYDFRQSNPTLVNVTFSRNYAKYAGGGMTNYYDCSPTVTNCIFWGNNADVEPGSTQMFNQLSSSPVVSYTVMQGGCFAPASCEHILTSNPQFVDDDGPDGIAGTLDDDLRLQVTSPAIDAGHNDAVPADTLDLDSDEDTAEKLPFDLDGHRRIAGGTVDMGAYEWPLSLTLTKTVTIDDGGTATIFDFQAYLDGEPAPWGIPQPVISGTHTVSETMLSGYSAGLWGGECDTGGTVAVVADQDATCAIVNDDIAPTVTLTKTVINDDGGFATTSDFQAYLDGEPVPWGVAQPVISGTHTVSETFLLGYSAGSWGGDCDQDGNVTLSIGQSALCSITNDDWPRIFVPLMLKAYGL